LSDDRTLMLWSIGAGSIFGSADSGTAGGGSVPGVAVDVEAAAGVAVCGWAGSVRPHAPQRIAAAATAASKG
jgi:hypothetical protein